MMMLEGLYNLLEKIRKSSVFSVIDQKINSKNRNHIYIAYAWKRDMAAKIF